MIINKFFEDDIVDDLLFILENRKENYDKKISKLQNNLFDFQKLLADSTLEFIKNKKDEKAEEILAISKKETNIKTILNSINFEISSIENIITLIFSNKSEEKESLKNKLINFLILNDINGEKFLNKIIGTVRLKDGYCHNIYNFKD